MEPHTVFIDRITISKMAILPKIIYRFNAIHIKIPMMYFTEQGQIFQKFMWNNTMPWITLVTLRKNKVGEIMLTNIKLYYKAIVITTTWYRHKNRQIDQWSRTESPEINPHLYHQFICDKGGKDIQLCKDSLFNK